MNRFCASILSCRLIATLKSTVTQINVKKLNKLSLFHQAVKSLCVCVRVHVNVVVGGWVAECVCMMCIYKLREKFLVGKFNFLIAGNSRNLAHWILSLLSNTFSPWKTYKASARLCTNHMYIVLSWLSTERLELAKWIENGKAANCIYILLVSSLKCNFIR